MIYCIPHNSLLNTTPRFSLLFIIGYFKKLGMIFCYYVARSVSLKSSLYRSNHLLEETIGLNFVNMKKIDPNIVSGEHRGMWKGGKLEINIEAKIFRTRCSSSGCAYWLDRCACGFHYPPFVPFRLYSPWPFSWEDVRYDPLTVALSSLRRDLLLNFDIYILLMLLRQWLTRMWW